jgi:hypothetical protein
MFAAASLNSLCCAVLCCAVLRCDHCVVTEGGDIPPGNAPGETKWQSRVVRPKADIKLTAGKAINVPIETLIDQVVKTNKVGGLSFPWPSTCTVWGIMLRLDVL